MTALLCSEELLDGPDLWVAVPHDRAQAPIAVVSAACGDLHSLLLAAGIDPASCAIGRGRLSSVEIAIDWDRVCFQTFAGA